MNLNQLAEKIAKKEEGKKQISIAQIKEVIGHLAVELYEDSILKTMTKKEENALYKKLVATGKRRAEKLLK